MCGCVCCVCRVRLPDTLYYNRVNTPTHQQPIASQPQPIIPVAKQTQRTQRTQRQPQHQPIIANGTHNANMKPQVPVLSDRRTAKPDSKLKATSAIDMTVSANNNPVHWKKHLDKSTNRYYYFNTRTKAKSSKIPKCLLPRVNTGTNTATTTHILIHTSLFSH